jgi:hypothetical protein
VIIEILLDTFILILPVALDFLGQEKSLPKS